MGREIVHRRALENIVTNDIAGLMRAAAAHHRPLHGKQFDHARQLFFDRFFVPLMRQRIAGFKTPFRLPGPSFFHHRTSFFSMNLPMTSAQ